MFCLVPINLFCLEHPPLSSELWPDPAFKILSRLQKREQSNHVKLSQIQQSHFMIFKSPKKVISWYFKKKDVLPYQPYPTVEPGVCWRSARLHQGHHTVPCHLAIWEVDSWLIRCIRWEWYYIYKYIIDVIIYCEYSEFRMSMYIVENVIYIWIWYWIRICIYTMYISYVFDSHWLELIEAIV